MRRFARYLLVPALAFILAAPPASAAEILVDFEHFPGADGVLGTADDVPAGSDFMQGLDSKYASIGLRFTQGTLFRSAFFNSDPENHFISSTNPIGLLSVPVTGISIDSYSIWDATLTAYDLAGNVLAAQTLVNPLAGQEFLRGSLSVSTSESIYSFSVLPANPDWILNLDNLRLTVAAPVPEPAQYALFISGLLLVGAMARKRQPLPRKR